ncbi:PIN domain-containing protein [Rhizobium mesosinicum]|uniref:PIN domain-containing protein n=1 Tax=Rhizobium mesosinicum TaxID=335017 RepID=A0ABS7H0R0_9HYPH|nr:PIN domain-containing protein [Rhizobium mesosinicum]
MGYGTSGRFCFCWLIYRECFQCAPTLSFINDKPLEVESILRALPILPLDVPADIKYGDIRAELEAAGQTIGLNDLLIAAHARALDLTLATDNMREFQRIRGLNLQNWLER